MLLCRSLGFFLLTLGLVAYDSQAASSSGLGPQRSGRRWLAVLAGAAVLGLGVYSRADFVLILAATGAGLLFSRRKELIDTLRECTGLVLGGLAVFALTASPMLLALKELLSTSAAMSEHGSIDYRVRVLWSVLDGSYFYRLMEQGGRFEAIFEVPSPATLFGPLVIASSAVLILLAFYRSRSGDPGSSLEPQGNRRPAALVFLPLLCALLAGAMVLLPGAVRAHHMLNLHPFVQLMVAGAAVELWRRSWGDERRRAAIRGAVGLALTALVVSNLVVLARSEELINRSGGRGRWSDALSRFASEIDESPGAVPTTVVSLDWGFHEPLLFLTDEALLLEPIWSIPRAHGRGRPWAHEGDAETIYLVHDEPYDLFGLSPSLLSTARGLPPERVAIRRHEDREGATSFLSVRFLGDHQLVYAGGFSLRFF
jgi:hypothetical protein